MAYERFLSARRELIARVIRDAYTRLSAEAGPAVSPPPATVDALVAEGEGTLTEFKGTLRVNLHTKQPDPRMELGIVKTIAGFLNSRGGTLIVGVTDDGQPVGVPAADQFLNEDKMNLHLVNLVTGRVGVTYMMYVHPRFEDFEGSRVMVVECWPARSPVFVKDGSVERFYIRAGASTAELTASQAQEYAQRHFK
jgi:predicted HTH transcriptional regulator